MYLHVGSKKNIRKSSIVGIFDMDNATVSTITRKYLSGAQRKRLVESAGLEIPKSFVMYREGNEYRICFSQLSTSALRGRLSSSGISESYGESEK